MFALAVLLSAAALMVRMLASTRGIPLLDGDSAFFAPCAYNLATHGQFANPFVSVIAENPQRLCIWHGWLFPYLVARLPWSDDYGTLESSVALLTAICAAIALAALDRAASGDRKMVAHLLPPMVVLLLFQSGRPELVVSGLVAMGALIVSSSLVNSWQWPMWGVCLGAVAAASPAGGVGYALVSCIVGVVGSRTVRHYLLQMSVIGSSAMISLCALTVSLAPVPLPIWLAGIVRNAQTQYVARTSQSSVLTYYVSEPTMPLLVLYAGSACILAYALLKQTQGWRRGALAVWLGLGVLFVYRMAVSLPETNYNFALFAPAIMFGSARVATQYHASHVMRKSVLFLVAVAIPALLYSTLATVISMQGVTEQDFEAGMSVLKGRGGSICAPLAFAMPVAIAVGIDRVSRCGEPQELRPPRFIVIKQANGGADTPQVPGGYRLIVNRFTPRTKLARWISLRTRKDWSYAIVERD